MSGLIWESEKRNLDLRKIARRSTRLRSEL